MVAHLLRLKWTLLRAGFRRNGWQLAGFVTSLVLGVLAAAAVALGLGALRMEQAPLAATVVVVVTSVVGFVLFLVPLVSTGVDDTLDPSRFALLPVRSRDLLPGLVLASFVGASGVALVLCAVGAVVGLARSAALLGSALVAAVLWVVTTLVLRNAAAAGISAPSTPRWVRDLATGVGVLLAAGSGLAVQGVMAGVQSREQLTRRLDILADVAGWTPFGLPWAVPRAVGTGDWLGAGLRLALACVVLGAALWVWERSVAQRLVSPLESGGSGRQVRTGGLARLAPRTPAGAVMMRSLINWRRDPRYVMQFATALLMPFLVVVPTLVQGVEVEGSPALSCTGVAVASSFALVTMQDTSYDGSALWAHVVAGIRGVQDRWGRLLAVLVTAVPLMALACVVGTAFSGRWDQLANGIGVSLGLLLAGAGVGQLTSALWQFPAAPPGGNQFSTPPGSTLATFLAMLCTGLAASALSVLALVGWLLTREAGWVHHLVGPVTLVLGALVAWAAVVVAGRWLDGHWPEVLAAASERTA